VSSAVGSQLNQLRSYSEIGDSQQGCEAVNMEVEGSTALEAVARQRLVKTADWEDLVCAAVNCGVCESVIVLWLLVVMICKCLINPITNPNPVYSHSTKS
jgi:hypothetical protein